VDDPPRGPPSLTESVHIARPAVRGPPGGGTPEDVPPGLSPRPRVSGPGRVLVVSVPPVPLAVGELPVVGGRGASVRVSAPDTSVARAHLALTDVVDSPAPAVAVVRGSAVVVTAVVVSTCVRVAACVRVASCGSGLHVTARPGADRPDRVVVAHSGVTEVVVGPAYIAVAVAL